MRFEDTICAPATPVGAGAISIVRISGDRALEALDAVVRFVNGTAALSRGYSLKRAEIPELDDVLVAIFRAPHSYTGEDCAELYCHASAYIVENALQRLVEAGCRLAEPGEFTQRAFLNGKMDLAQAEAVADVIASNSALSLQIARNQLKGGYSAELRELRSQLLELTALLELELDFSDEDVEFADRSRLQVLLGIAIDHVRSLAASFKEGNAIRNGIPVAIVGAVNSGKSTLLNALVGDERAIVSNIAGTTRDTVEETMMLDGMLYRFIDTAGIRETSDRVEAMGVERSLTALGKASVVLCVIDGSSAPAVRQESLQLIQSRLHDGQDLLVLWNKSDLAACDSGAAGESPEGAEMTLCAAGACREGAEMTLCAAGESPEDAEMTLCAAGANGAVRAAALMPEGAIAISALTGAGLDELRRRLSSLEKNRISEGQTYVTNLRHSQALNKSLLALERASGALVSGLSSELVAEDLRDAISALGEITGEISTDEVLGEIFGRFCIGK